MDGEVLRKPEFGSYFLNFSLDKTSFRQQLFPVCLIVLASGLPWRLSGKESAYNAGDAADKSLIPRSGRSPGEGKWHPLHDSCLENPMDRGAWWATAHGVAKSQT